jgi:hypothetical protein
MFSFEGQGFVYRHEKSKKKLSLFKMKNKFEDDQRVIILMKVKYVNLMAIKMCKRLIENVMRRC